MTTGDLLTFHLKLCHIAYRVMTVKNNDYAGAGGQTPFANFEATEALGICSTLEGICVRMGDKLKRLITFAQSGKLLVPNEGAQDACLDLLNYAVLFAAYCQQKEQENG